MSEWGQKDSKGCSGSDQHEIESWRERGTNRGNDKVQGLGESSWEIHSGAKEQRRLALLSGL